MQLMSKADGTKDFPNNFYKVYKSRILLKYKEQIVFLRKNKIRFSRWH